MELLHINTARVIWAMHISDLNPRGRNLDSLLKWLVSRYKFEKYPASSHLEDQSTGYVFATGSFSRGQPEDDNVYVDLTIFNDGVVANTRSSTKDTEAFLFEAITLAAAEVHLVFRPEMIWKKLYLSEIDVRMDKPLTLLNPRLKAFAERISVLQGNVPPITYDLTSIVIPPDPSLQQWRPSQFQLERRLNLPASQNRYYSAAPVQTDDHLELLKLFEDNILVG